MTVSRATVIKNEENNLAVRLSDSYGEDNYLLFETPAELEATINELQEEYDEVVLDE